MTWQEDANCRGMPPTLFFPPRGDTLGVIRAKAICTGCPVTAECLQYANDHYEGDGVWGGLAAGERRRGGLGQTRLLQPVRHGTPGGFSAHWRRGEEPCEPCKAARNAQSTIDRAARRRMTA